MIAPYINVSKLDVGKRQLETAIKLFLTDADPISIHTLSAAAQEVFNCLLKKQGSGVSFIEKSIKEFVEPGKQEEIKKHFASSKNFFKHANNDSDGVHKFYFKLTEWFLWDTCNMYKSLTGESPELVSVFLIWFYSAHRDVLITDLAKQQLFDKLLKSFSLTSDNKSKFLELLPELVVLQNK